MSSLRSALILGAITTFFVLACGGSNQQSTETPGKFDIDTGPCLCRNGQDESTTCCRGGMSLTCQCVSSSSYACNLVPNGRTCGQSSL